MVSLISTMLNAVISFFLYILKAFFSMLAWFLKSLFKVLKLFFCALPITSIAFLALFILNIYMVLRGIPQIGAFAEYEEFLEKDVATSVKLFRDLRIWWVLNIYPSRGSISFILLIILSVIMIVPVLAVVLCIGVFMSFGKFLFYAICADVVLYLVRAIFQKSFVTQFLDRYYRLFPKAGKRHYEKKYEKWLRRHHEEFEDEEAYTRKNTRPKDFYDDDYSDDDYDDEDFSEEYEDDYYEDDEYPEKYEDDSYEDDEYPEEYEDEYYEDNEDFDDEDDDYEEDYEDSRETAHSSSSASTFDFFAGCNSKESVDRKYKTLVKLYHPDNMDGDNSALTEINVQYQGAKKRFG